MAIGAEPHVNTCYKHFFYFVTEFHLLHEKEFEPLKEMTRLTNQILLDTLENFHSNLKNLFIRLSGFFKNTVSRLLPNDFKSRLYNIFCKSHLS
jgi:hypothetical protein